MSSTTHKTAPTTATACIARSARVILNVFATDAAAIVSRKTGLTLTAYGGGTTAIVMQHALPETFRYDTGCIAPFDHKAGLSRLGTESTRPERAHPWKGA